MNVNDTWIVATSHISDGHARNTYIITFDNDAVRSYAKAVYPLVVYTSTHSSQRKAWEFVRENFYGFEEISPLTI